MSRRNLRDELRDVFDGISEPAHPALSARIREQIAAGSAPSTRTPRLAVAVAIATAAIVVGSLVFVSRHPLTPVTPAGQPTPSPAVSATTGPTAVPAPGASPTPSPSSSVPVDTGPPFQCSAQSGGTAPTPATGVATARAAAQTGYDRFVLEFAGPLPQYDAGAQSSATFVQDASGIPVTLAGSAGLVVRLHGAQAHGTFTGPTDIRPDGTIVLREARQVGDFEGVVTWGLGLSRPACFRAFTLTGPSRLIVDVQTS
jgi:hypothetical protein